MWEINFITREDFKNHVAATITTYGETLRSIDLEKFNKNIIDPIKLTFDSKVYDKTIEEVIDDEIVRQRDKTNNNAIGYFHQNIFRYINNCDVPLHGFDVEFDKSNGTKIFVEMKNKHNTMNSSSSQKTYTRMSHKIAENANYICYLVEIISKRSQNIPWRVSLDGESMQNDRIRRVSIDKFYSEVTGIENAFKQICDILPSIIDEIIQENDQLMVEDDTVIAELSNIDPNILKSLYILAFNTYEGFNI